MNLNIEVGDLVKKKLFIATPMYGGNCSGFYSKAIADLMNFAGKIGLDIKLYYLFNESLITRARNYCVDEFLRSDCTHMMFIDGDIAFNYKDVLTLLHLTGDREKQYDVMTGPYPKKTIAWEKIVTAVGAGVGKDNPHDLQNYVGDYVFNPAEPGSYALSEPMEIKDGGTGFMMISRHVFEEYDKHYPEYKYIPDHARTKHFDGTRQIMAYFDCIIDPESKRYLSEDYMFSQNVRKIGLKVWLCPWMKMQHIGMYNFGGSLAAIASINESPTTSDRSNQYKQENS
jgi:hypothetical protein